METVAKKSEVDAATSNGVDATVTTTTTTDAASSTIVDSTTTTTTTTTTTIAATTTESSNDEAKNEKESFDDPICCCLCGSAVDYADRSAFFKNDWDLKCKENENKPYDSDEYHWKQPTKLLPSCLYNPNNTLLFCDTCDRPYHQHCHFVPLLTIPKGDWHCLLCISIKELNGKEIIEFDNEEEEEENGDEKKNGKDTTSKASSSLDKQQQEQRQQQQPTKTTTTKYWTRKLLEDELWSCKPPPQDSMKKLQLAWEYQSKSLKIMEWKKQVSRLRTSLRQPLQQIRLTQSAILTYTSTRRARLNFTLRSQELKQTFWKLTSNKCKVRDWIINLEIIMKYNNNNNNKLLEEFCIKNPSEKDVWFPFGMENYPKRQVPRLIPPEVCVDQEETKKNKTTTMTTIPKEVQVVANGIASHDKKNHCHSNNNNNNNNNTKKSSSSSSSVTTQQQTTTTPSQQDDDDLISLEDLKCCICFRGEATDENDVLLCDGCGCFRAHHMKCLPKPMSQVEAEAEDDWFCPLCTLLAKLISDIQSEYTGDEWVVNGEDNDNSIASWENAHDVFPECVKEHEHATKWKEGKADDETKEFLYGLFGLSNGSKNVEEEEDNGELIMDDDDDEDDDDFDLDKHTNDEIEQAEREADDKEAIHASSTKVSKEELDALSSVSSSSEEEDESNDEKVQQPKRKRRRRAAAVACSTANSSRATSRTNTSGEEDAASEVSSSRRNGESNNHDIGRLDESNIIRGKRRRAKVDYAMLNDRMFGNLNATASKKIDDEDEFHFRGKFRNYSSSSSSSNDDESSGDDDDDDDNDNEDESDNNTDDKEKKPKGKSKGKPKNGSGRVARSRASSTKKKNPKNKRRTTTKAKKS